MSYAIFRCQSINTLNDLSYIGSHNKREKESYKSNPDIRKKDSKNNIELVKCDIKYREKFYEITKKYRKEHLKIINMLNFSKRKAFSDSVIIDGESFHILLKYLDLYTKEIQNQVIYQNFFNDLDDYIFNYKKLEKEYNHSQKVIDNLEKKCEKLDQNNNDLIDFIKHILKMLKENFRRILLSKNENDKKKTLNILKQCYEKDLYNPSDLIDISKDTDNEIEVNNFIKEEILEKEYNYFD